MTRLRSSPESLACTSWLVYATRGENDEARRVKNLILDIKKDRIDATRRVPVVRLVLDRITARLGESALAPFAGDPILVPVPGSGLTKPNTVWPARRICEELIRHGFGHDVAPVLARVVAVRKSAGSAERPTLREHVESLAVQKQFTPPSRLVIVDDVVTSGTTMMACAVKLAAAFPGVPVSGFALARVLSEGNPENVLLPATESIGPAGKRCNRFG
jgi:hypothetical protein